MSDLILPPGVSLEQYAAEEAVKEVQKGLGFLPFLRDASFPAHYVVHMPSGEIFCCEKHARGAVLWANAMGFKPNVSLAVPRKHNCRGCVAAHQAKFKPGRSS